VYRLLADDTIDERIMELLKTKQELFDQFADESVVGTESLKPSEQALLKNMVEEEKKRLDARKESFENNVKKMKKIMLESMNATGKTKFKTAKNSFWTQKNKASVVIDAKSVWDIPEDFRRYKDPEPDKTKIGEAIAAGQDFTGIAHMEQTESVRIK
jgi:hypothetical protein